MVEVKKHDKGVWGAFTVMSEGCVRSTTYDSLDGLYRRSMALYKRGMVLNRIVRRIDHYDIYFGKKPTASGVGGCGEHTLIGNMLCYSNWSGTSQGYRVLDDRELESYLQ